MDGSFYLWIVILIIFAICTIAMVVTDKCTNIYHRNKEKKFNETHQEYVQFLEQFNTMRDELWKTEEDLPSYRNTVKTCLEEMVYYPRYSEWYTYYENQLKVARFKIEKCKDAYEKKNTEIYNFVRANKAAIETIKDEDDVPFYNYQTWVRIYKLDDLGENK